MRIQFVRQDLTSYSGLELLRHYVRQLGVAARLRRACMGVGGDYGGVRLSLLVLALLYAGARRLEHLRFLAGDPMIVRLCGLRRIPKACIVFNWLKQFTYHVGAACRPMIRPVLPFLLIFWIIRPVGPN